MATDATFQNQLQALATATANFANDKDAAIKNTIITALGGSTQAGGGGTNLLNPNLRVEGGKITWDGNGSGSIAGMAAATPVTKNSDATGGIYLLDSDGTYRKDWLTYAAPPSP